MALASQNALSRGRLRILAGVGLCLVGLALVQPALAAENSTNRDDFWSSFENAGKTGSASDAPDNPPGQWTDWLKMLAALAFVLALIVLAAYLFRRFAPRSISQGRSDVIRIVATKMLGGRKTLMLVRVRGQTLLLALTPQSIQCLTEIHDLEGEWAQPPDSPEKPSSAFEQQLGRLVDIRSSGSSPKSS